MSVVARGALCLALMGLALVALGSALGSDPELGSDPKATKANETIHAQYRLLYRGVPVGEVNETWVRQGDEYRVQSDAQPYPILAFVVPTFRELSEGRVVGQTLQPRHFEHSRSDQAAPLMADFNWEAGELVNHFEGRTETVALNAGTQDALSIKFLFRIAGDAALNADIALTTGKRLETHHLALVAKEELDTMAGHFSTRHMADWNQQAESHFDIWLSDNPRNPLIRMQVLERGNRWEQQLQKVSFE